jgi:hypothetical protein
MKSKFNRITLYATLFALVASVAFAIQFIYLYIYSIGFIILQILLAISSLFLFALSFYLLTNKLLFLEVKDDEFIAKNFFGKIIIKIRMQEINDLRYMKDHTMRTLVYHSIYIYHQDKKILSISDVFYRNYSDWLKFLKKNRRKAI